MSRASISNELMRLHALKEKGVLTQGEFEKQKQKLLSDGEDEPEIEISQPTLYYSEQPKKSGCLAATLKILVVGVFIFVVAIALVGLLGSSKPSKNDFKRTESLKVGQQSTKTDSLKVVASADNQSNDQGIPESEPHRIRDPKIDQEVRSFRKGWKVSCYDVDGYLTAKQDVSSYANRRGESLEALAKAMNYDDVGSMIDVAYLGSHNVSEHTKEVFKNFDLWIVNRNTLSGVQQNKPQCVNY